MGRFTQWKSKPNIMLICSENVGLSWHSLNGFSSSVRRFSAGRVGEAGGDEAVTLSSFVLCSHRTPPMTTRQLQRSQRILIAVAFSWIGKRTPTHEREGTALFRFVSALCSADRVGAETNVREARCRQTNSATEKLTTNDSSRESSQMKIDRFIHRG